MPEALAAQDDKEYTAGVPANFPPQYQVDATATLRKRLILLLSWKTSGKS
ncbi:MAG: hypothetical protein WAW23_04860 [Candidatus Methanoperedens sp.]